MCGAGNRVGGNVLKISEILWVLWPDACGLVVGDLCARGREVAIIIIIISPHGSLLLRMFQNKAGQAAWEKLLYLSLGKFGTCPLTSVLFPSLGFAGLEILTKQILLQRFRAV